MSDLHLQKSSPGLSFTSLASSDKNLYSFMNIDFLLLMEMIFFQVLKGEKCWPESSVSLLGLLLKWCD